VDALQVVVCKLVQALELLTVQHTVFLNRRRVSLRLNFLLLLGGSGSCGAHIHRGSNRIHNGGTALAASHVQAGDNSVAGLVLEVRVERLVECGVSTLLELVPNGVELVLILLDEVDRVEPLPRLLQRLLLRVLVYQFVQLVL